MTDILLQLLLLVLVSLCAVTDLYSGKIRNVVVLPIAAAGIILRIYIYGWANVPEMTASVFFPFPVLYLIWKITCGRGIGGGDIKLLMSVAVLTPVWSVLPLYLVSFLTAGLYGMICVLANQAGYRRRKGIHLSVFIALAAGLHIAGLY